MDAAAPSGIPYVHGNTSTLSVELYQGDNEKYRNIFQLDVPEVYYGSGFIEFLQGMTASGQWEPKNNKVHIVQGQISYTQLISQATQEAIADTNGEWVVGAITDIQFPVQDWAPVIRALRTISYRGVNGLYEIDPETNSGISYPNMTDDPEGGQAHLFFQVQNNEHRIIAPASFAEVAFATPPWW